MNFLKDCLLAPLLYYSPFNRHFIMSHVFLSTKLENWKILTISHSFRWRGCRNRRELECQWSLRDTAGENLRLAKKQICVPKMAPGCFCLILMLSESYSPLSLRLQVLGLWTLHPSYFVEKKNTFLHLVILFQFSFTRSLWSPGEATPIPPGIDPKVKLFTICLLCWKVKDTWACFARPFPCGLEPSCPLFFSCWLCAQGVRNHSKVFLFVTPVPTI